MITLLVMKIEGFSIIAQGTKIEEFEMKMQRCQKFWESIDFLYLEKEAEQHDKTPCISKVTKNA